MPFSRFFMLPLEFITVSFLGFCVIFKSDANYSKACFSDPESYQSDDDKNIIRADTTSYAATLPELKNRIGWELLPDVQTPEGYEIAFSYNMPFFADEKIINGKIEPLHKGITRINSPGFWKPNAGISTSNCLRFSNTYFSVQEAAKQLIKDGKWDNEKHGNPYRIFEEPANPDDITPEGAFIIGEQIAHHFNFYHYTFGKDEYIYCPENWYLSDEENFTGNRISTFLTHLIKGYNQGEPKGNFVLYGHRINWTLAPFIDLENPKLEDIYEKHINERGFLNQAKGSTFWLESGSYSKVPFIVKSEIYETDNRDRPLNKGAKLKYKKTDIQEPIFKRNTPILNSRTEGVERASYGELPETQLFQRNYYNFANNILYNFLMLNHSEFKDYDISKDRPKRNFKPYSEIRITTENWTYGGNSKEVRDIGEYGIKFMTWFALCSGLKAVSFFDIGVLQKDPSTLLKTGQIIRDTETGEGKYEDCTKFHLAIYSANRFLKSLEGEDLNHLQYVHFYQPVIGEINKEIVASGVYTGKKLILMYCDLSNSVKRKHYAKLRIGKTIKSLEIIGRKVYLVTIPTPNGLKSQDFVLSYQNILSQGLKVRGVVNNDWKAHYIKQ